MYCILYEYISCYDAQYVVDVTTATDAINTAYGDYDDYAEDEANEAFNSILAHDEFDYHVFELDIAAVIAYETLTMFTERAYDDEYAEAVNVVVNAAFTQFDEMNEQAAHAAYRAYTEDTNHAGYVNDTVYAANNAYDVYGYYIYGVVADAEDDFDDAFNVVDAVVYDDDVDDGHVPDIAPAA